MQENRKQHWETVYETKNPDQVSWTQAIPQTSLDFITSFNISKEAKIIDIGGGDSQLVDFLIAAGFTNLTVLDISSKAIEKAKQRLGEKAEKVTWIASDITAFEPTETYDVWHDRAAFHFLTSNEEIEKYVAIATKYVSKYLIIGTFSTDGPKKCSGLDIKQYSEESLTAQWENGFEKKSCITEDHMTPFETKQNFVFCSFKRKLK